MTAIMTAIAVGVVGTAVALFLSWGGRDASPRVATQQPTLEVDTSPAGAIVFVDGQPRGVAPLTLALEAGPHILKVHRGTEEHVVPVKLETGTRVTQYFDLKPSEPVVPATGSIAVVTNPSGASVKVDGQTRGVSPLTVSNVAPGDHVVVVTGEEESFTSKVAVVAGATASAVFALPRASAPYGGWLSIAAPFDVEISENNEVVGASGTSRLMLAAGRHELVLANHALGFQEARKIEIEGGKTTAVRLDPPKVPLSANARPWADVVIDGAIVGQTPIANVAVALGPHKIVFRHPQFGERPRDILVTANGPNRVAVDFSKAE